MPITAATANNLPSLKRKEFPSHQRRVPMPPSQKNLLLPNQHQQRQYVPENRFGPAGGRRVMDPAEEVEELSRAARKQMAILGGQNYFNNY